MCFKKLEILWVEDKLNFELLHEMLVNSNLGSFALDQTTNLEFAVQKTCVKKYDIIILDLNLPDSLGLDTVKHLINLNKTVPIIILTGLYDEDLAIRAVKAGAQDYLVKSQLNRNHLASSIKYAIERKKIQNKSVNKHMDS